MINLQQKATTLFLAVIAISTGYLAFDKYMETKEQINSLKYISMKLDSIKTQQQIISSQPINKTAPNNQANISQDQSLNKQQPESNDKIANAIRSLGNQMEHEMNNVTTNENANNQDLKTTQDANNKRESGGCGTGINLNM